MSGPQPIRIGIVGGGTAGYLAALALRIKRPELAVTMIESSRIPVIGVGEGTTPIMVPFLHGYLGLDVSEFHTEVQPTWKIGVRLDWGAADDTHFEFPFDAHGLTDSFRFTGNINSGSLGALLMGRRAGLHLQRADWTYQALVQALPYAYHLDNRRFVRYLQRKAAEHDVPVIDALIEHVEMEQGGGVGGLVATDGRRFKFDLYIDCSGFASILLERVGSKFISYGRNLFTNAALVADAPHTTAIGPFTHAQTMDAGWCWSLPQTTSDHRGYVFCSDFLEPDAAADEMRAHCPGLGEPRLVRFRSGRRTHWWKDNVVGLGNAYGFVEPLEATALHMVVRQIAYVVKELDTRLVDPALPTALNETVGTLWDNLSGLLALHYKHNRRRDTSFWRTARAETELGAIESSVAAVLARGPASGPSHDPSTGTLLGGLEDEINLLLLGMKVFSPDLIQATASQEQWNRRLAMLNGWASRALSVKQSLAMVCRDSAAADPRGGMWYEGVLSGLENPIR